MPDIPIVGKIPTTNVADGTRVSDINGIVYSYNAATDTWVQNGVIKTPPVVTESQNGLVYPALYRKLNLIKLLKENGINWDNFQFATNNGFKPYFYYFNSSDGLIKFIPESANRLRIEVDRPKLYSRILGLCCVGPKGDTGSQGLAGDDGKPVANEPKFTTSIKSDGSYSIDAKINIPIDTKISVRFFSNKDILISEILIDLDGTVTIDDAVGSSVITLTKSNGSATIKGSVTFVDSQDSLYYKARQIGPTGKDGEDGSSSIEIIEDIFSDAGVQSAEALITIRKSGVDDNLTFVKQEMFSKNIFSSISGITDLPLDDVQNVEYVSLRVNTDDCKDIGKFKFIPPSLSDVTLNIPSWSPMCNCTDTFRYQIQKFDWYKNIPSQLPFTLVQEPPPPEKCCQEDFYFCPNQGDLCGVVGLPTAPVRVPMQSDIQLKKHENESSGVTDSGSIPSDSPPFVPCNLIPQNDIELDGDGVILPIVTDDGENISESVVVNRGKPDLYTQEIQFTEFNSEFTINVDIQIGNRDGTFEGGTSFVVPIDNPAGEPTQEQLDNPCSLHSSAVLTIAGGAIAMILPSPSQEVQHDSIQNGGNSIKRITYTGLAMSAGSSVKLSVNINDTLLNCCLPYAIKTSVSTVVSDSGADNPGSGSSAASGDDDDDDDFTDDDIAPAADSPLIRTPEVPVIRPLINPPDVDGDEDDVFANAARGDVPMLPDYAWRPVAINRPVLQDLMPQISGMLIGETNREIEVNANLSDRIIIDITTPSDNTDPRSVTFPINGDPTVGEMLWTVSRIEFEREGSYLPNGPLGTGFYFLQKSNFVVSSRFTKLNNIQTRTDTFGNGFLYISGTSLSDVDGPSNMSIVSYGVDWTINSFVNNISGFGSNWIRQVNRGVEEVGDAVFQLILDSELNIVRDISTAQKVSYTDAFVSLLYNPFGCATINIPQTITSISGAILGGRCEEASGPTQTASLSFVPIFDNILEDVPSMMYTMNVVMTTSDGLPLEQTTSVNILDSGLGTAVAGADYTFSDDLITWAVGTPSGTPATRVINIINNASAADNTVIINLGGATNATIVDGTFTLTITHIQTVLVTWNSAGATASSDSPSTYTIGMTLTTNDGLPTVALASVDVDDVAVTLIETLDYTYVNPETVTFISGTASGSTGTVTVAILGAGNNGYTEFNLSNGVGCTTSGTFTLTLFFGGGGA